MEERQITKCNPKMATTSKFLKTLSNAALEELNKSDLNAYARAIQKELNRRAKKRAKREGTAS